MIRPRRRVVMLGLERRREMGWVGRGGAAGGRLESRGGGCVLGGGCRGVGGRGGRGLWCRCRGLGWGRGI